MHCITPLAISVKDQGSVHQGRLIYCKDGFARGRIQLHMQMCPGGQKLRHAAASGRTRLHMQ